MADVEMVGRGKSLGFKLFGTFIAIQKPQKKRSPLAAAAAATPLPCPRCHSRETRFCYFNNYNLNQPRHYCKVCHRYWTAGGTLRKLRRNAGSRRCLFAGVIEDNSSHEECNGEVWKDITSGLQMHSESKDGCHVSIGHHHYF